MAGLCSAEVLRQGVSTSEGLPHDECSEDIGNTNAANDSKDGGFSAVSQ